MKTTKWYTASVKPVRIGVYETDLGNALEKFGFSYWDGNRWGNQYKTPEEAIVWGFRPGVQDKFWRGLTEKAK
jgi:hypothetical protein